MKDKLYWQRMKTEGAATLGRPRAFEDPADLWAVACDYFKECDDNPWLKTDFKGKDNEEVQIPTQRPYLWQGLDAFCFEKGYCTSLKDYRTGARNPKYKDGRYANFAEVITRIEAIMSKNKLEGALVGAYNSNLTARLEELVDRTENKTEVTLNETRIGFDPAPAEIVDGPFKLD